ncbi:hypothetical protein ACPVTF_05150 [Geobacillus icigianus]|uniref:hypothetical protein n=1 Tax=Geobacillus TaxID=129337 RepID=UPI00053A9CA9|nr:hypothetical protein [Geobacillus sp. B4113_201601]
MKKTISLIFTVFAFLMLSGFSFSQNPKPKSYLNGSTTVYYFDLRSPENRSGLIKASGPHYQENPNLWTALANGARAYKNMWYNVSAWESQSMPSGAIILKQRDLVWKGSLQTSIDSAISSLRKQYPNYDIKEVMVYPVHYPRTYPVSAADALMLMAEDEYQKSSELDLEIDMGFSTVPKIERPFGGGTFHSLGYTSFIFSNTPIQS